jgi:thioredoxin reductase (NADPH)
LSALKLTLYSRAYCHLCEDMIAGLHALQARFQFSLNVVDIDSDASLEECFGEHVPVLMHGERELCRHALAATVVTDYLAQIG